MKLVADIKGAKGEDEIKLTKSHRLLEDKNILVLGVANKKSIAWIIVEALVREEAQVLVHCHPRDYDRVDSLIKEEEPELSCFSCDVNDDSQIDALFRNVVSHTSKLDGIVHCIAFAPKTELEGRYLDTSREGERVAFETSSTSLKIIIKKFEPLLAKGASIVTLTYLGGERVIPNYNVMGPAKAALESTVRYLAMDLGEKKIRVNALSAPPVPTRSSRAIKDIENAFEIYQKKAPLGWIEVEKIANVACILLSDYTVAITGQTVYTDGGYNILGL